MLDVLKVSVENNETLIFIIIISILFIIGLILALLARFTSNKNHERFKPIVKFIPTAMSTIGVIGTFLGIFLGLLNFDVSDIDHSVPDLLAGLKIAFATSIYGMVAALTFRMVEHIGRASFGSKPEVIGPEASNSTDPIIILNKIVEAIDAQTKALVGDNENSLVGVMQKNRQEMRDGFKDQISSLVAQTKALVGDNENSLVGVMQKNRQEMRNGFKDQISSLVAQTKALVGDNENSLVGVMQKNRQEMRDGFKDQISSLVAQTEALVGDNENSLVGVMQKNRQEMRNGFKDQISSLVAQTKALVGDNENSLVGVMQKNRQEIHDGFKDQISSFDKFAEQMKDGATEKIVEALKDAIEGFNDKITEQFGDNFKALNSAVGNLNSWQQNYKTHLEESEEALKQQVRSFEEIATNISGLSQEAKTLPQMAENMKQANTELLENFASMNDLLESLSRIKSDAENVLPQIENSLSNTSKIMENASEAMSNSITNTSQTMETTASDMAANMRHTLEQTHTGINSNFETFDQQMQSELVKVLEHMGTQLTSLSDKFVKDYTPLTDQLQRLTQNLGSVNQ